jgi:hypothetical protein
VTGHAAPVTSHASAINLRLNVIRDEDSGASVGRYSGIVGYRERSPILFSLHVKSARRARIFRVTCLAGP